MIFPMVSDTEAASTNSSDPEIKFFKIYSEIDNNYAITDIYKKVKNPYDYSIDDTFSVRIPNKAFISNFSLTIDGETIYAQIVPKDLAKQKYNAAVLSGSDAALM